MYTYMYLVGVRACVFVYSSVHVCVWGGGGEGVLRTRVWVGVCVCVGGGGGGGVHAHVYGCARCTRVSVGWGARTCVHVCAQSQHVCMCSLNTWCPPDSINFVIIVIACALKLKFAIHVLMLD